MTNAEFCNWHARSRMVRDRAAGSGFMTIARFLFVVVHADFTEDIAAGRRSPRRLQYVLARRTGSVVVIDGSTKTLSRHDPLPSMLMAMPARSRTSVKLVLVNWLP